MAYATYSTTGTGSLTSFSFPFSYNHQSDIDVKVGGVVTPYTYTSANTILLGTAPGVGVSVVITRTTPITSAEVLFAAPGALSPDMLNQNTNQVLFAVQEAKDSIVDYTATTGAAATAASSSATASANSATNSSNSATASANSATTSTSQAGIATTQAGIATTQAGLAATSAAGASTSAATATTKASESATSATNSTNQVANATTQAGIATTKAAEAAASAASITGSVTTASNYATAAANSAASVSAAASTATTQAAAALSSANAAAASAGASATSATNSSNSATNASNSATTAVTMANSASASATTATGSLSASATNAATSGTNAANAASSATSANNSAVSATASALTASTAATNAANSATTASTNASTAVNSATSAANSASSMYASVTASAAGAATSTAKASEAASSAAAINATFGNAAALALQAQNAQSAASLAQGYAASASSVVQQDLSGITSQALHRSPNAITAQFIYDTSKDSDGGAWTEKCQQTSWYNEALAGKWLGPQASELEARYSGATISATELVTNGDFSSNTWWSTGGAAAISGGSLNFTAAVATSGAYRLGFATVGKYYELTFEIVSISSGGVQIALGTSLGTNRTAAGVYTQRILCTGNGNLTLYSVGASTTASVDNISVREVTALTTASNDYFQLTTDGKFYRLYKNLLLNTGTLTAAGGWSVSNATSVVGATDPNAGTSAYTFTATANNGYIFRQSNKAISGLQHTNSIYVRRVSGSGAVTLYNDLGSEVAITLTTSWARYSTTWTATGVNGYCGIKLAVSGDVVEIWNPQEEIGNVATTYEAKVAEGTTSEIFRGNKADFPRLAAIVAEATSVNIYDLTEPGRPMWMRFKATGSTGPIYADIKSVAALNGIVCAAVDPHLAKVNFVSDSIFSYRNSTGQPSFHGDFPTGIAGRNGSLVYLLNSTSAQLIINATANAVAMTVLPDAPIDPATSLRVPTIAVATASGVSVIKHNGTVVNSSSTTAANTVVLSPYLLEWGIDSSGVVANWLLAKNPGSLGASFAGTWSNWWKTFSDNSTTYYSRKVVSEGRIRGRLSTVSSYGGVALALHNTDASARGLGVGITRDYNTGWLTGDIRRAYLSDVTAESISGSELVTNGTFASNVSGWTALNGGSIAWSSGAAVVTGAGANTTGVYQPITCVIGKTYRFQATCTLGTATTADVAVNASAAGSGGSLGTTYGYLPSSQTFVAYFTATSTTHSVVLMPRGVGLTATFDNVTVTEAVLDRSYKAASAVLNGTLAKSQLASGTSLVGFSGFSASNYLREPYSADLDFGTGEWNASAWVNISAGPRYNLLTYTDGLRTTEWGSASNLTRVLSGGGTPSTGSGNYTRLTATAGNTDHYLQSAGITFVSGVNYTISYEVQYVDHRWVGLVWFDGGLLLGSTFDLLNGAVGSNLGNNSARSITPLGGGRYRISISRTSATTGAVYAAVVMLDSDKSFQTTTASNLTATIVDIGLVDLRVSTAPSGYQRVVDGTETFSGIIAERAFSSGPKLTLSVVNYGNLQAIAFDGTTTRTVTTTAAYNIAQWLKAEANYTTDGSLTIRVNGREVAATRGNPLRPYYGRKNLLNYSHTFSNAIWVGVFGGAKVSTNNSDPDGGTNAVEISFANQYAYLLYNSVALFVSGQQYTLSFWARRSSGSNAISVYADPSTLIGSYSPTSTWTRYSITFTWSGASAPLMIAQDRNASGFTNVQLYGFQLELGAAATTYTPTTDVPSDGAPLTIGNNYAADAPFPGTIALLKLGATVPTPEQATFMYEQEKQLFRANAQSVLPDTGSIVDMAYDDATDRWVAVSAANESYWTGLIRNTVTPVPAGSYTKIVATSGIELAARSTTNPGVDVTIPAYGLREELVKRSEAAARLSKELALYDYVGGFTANTTSGSTAITSASTITYPGSCIGARISGTGIPTNATIVAISGTTLYLSAAATATGTTVSISFLDFALPIGMEAKEVLTAGSMKQEGSTKDYTRLYDGFIETIRYGVAPGATAWVQIQAQRITS